jgi:hypothetical protein
MIGAREVEIAAVWLAGQLRYGPAWTSSQGWSSAATNASSRAGVAFRNPRRGYGFKEALNLIP